MPTALLPAPPPAVAAAFAAMPSGPRGVLLAVRDRALAAAGAARTGAFTHSSHGGDRT